jgi:hypothetical protein
MAERQAPARLVSVGEKRGRALLHIQLGRGGTDTVVLEAHEAADLIRTLADYLRMRVKPR